MIGFDKYETNNLLYLHLPFNEGVDVIANDISKWQVPGTLSGGPPAWATYAVSGIPYLDFDGANPDWVECLAAAVHLDFTAGDFSYLVWAWTDDMSLDRTLMCRGLLDTDGYHCAVLIDGTIIFYTNQGAANQSSFSAPAAITTGNWNLIGFTRSGDSVRVFRQGVDITDTEGIHINPLTSARDLHIGIYDSEAANTAWHGHMQGPRMWGRQLSALQMKMIWEYERSWFGV